MMWALVAVAAASAACSSAEDHVEPARQAAASVASTTAPASTGPTDPAAPEVLGTAVEATTVPASAPTVATDPNGVIVPAPSGSPAVTAGAGRSVGTVPGGGGGTAATAPASNAPAVTAAPVNTAAPGTSPPATSPPATAPVTTPRTNPPPTAPPTTAPPPTAPPALDVGTIYVSLLGPGTYDFLAPEAERCASATWIIKGPVTFTRGPIPPPNGCFARAHEFDMTWEDAVWPKLSKPGAYTVTLRLTSGARSGERTEPFVVS